MSSAPRDDRTAKARIRDAAISCVAKHGIAGTTVRKIASVADVSPGLVIHHFGSMEGLRAACDDHVASVIREGKLSFADEGLSFDPLAALRNADSGTLAGYLAAVLTEDSPAVSRLVDDLVTDAEGYMRRYEDAGWVKPSAAPRARAAILLIWNLGALVLHRHMQRLVGVDVTDPEHGSDPATITTYWAPAFEVLGGIFTDEFAQEMQTMIGGLAQQPGPEPQEGS
ncbi:MAG: TetR family transcriptional regulator [Acidimicrobiia bacterium]